MTQPAEILAFRPKAAQRVETVAYRRSWDDTKARASRRRGQLAERQAATVAKRLALAHHIAAQIEAGVYGDQADVARQHGLPQRAVHRLRPQVGFRRSAGRVASAGCGWGSGLHGAPVQPQ